MKIYVLKNDEQYGPYTVHEAAVRLAAGEFLGTDKARCQGEPDWLPLAEILLTEGPSRARDETRANPVLMASVPAPEGGRRSGESDGDAKKSTRSSPDRLKLVCVTILSVIALITVGLLVTTDFKPVERPVWQLLHVQDENLVVTFRDSGLGNGTLVAEKIEGRIENASSFNITLVYLLVEIYDTSNTLLESTPISVVPRPPIPPHDVGSFVQHFKSGPFPRGASWKYTITNCITEWVRR